MKPKNNSRAAELGDILTRNTSGFTVRKRSGIGLFFHIFQLACMVILGAALLVYYRSPMGCALAIAIGLSFVAIAINLEKNKKIKDALEFMNALFSSAMGKGYAFAFIVKTTGEIVFYNRPFQTVFPEYIAQDERTLKTLFDLYHLPEAHCTKMLEMMSTKTEGTIATTIRGSAASEDQSFTLLIENIERPTGFFLIRGK